MAYEGANLKHSFEAGQDLSSNQFHFVTVASDGQVDPTGDGARAHAVLQDKPSAAGRVGECVIFGITKITAGGSITRGNPVSSNASGRAVAAGSNDNVLGIALETSTGNGQVIAMLFQPQGEYFA